MADGDATGPDNVFALEILFDAIRAQFTADKRACDFSFGWREPARQGQLSSANITMIPGDPSGALGDTRGARFPGSLPARPLAGLAELFTVNLQAYDAAAPHDERAQYRATRRLYDDFMRAFYLAAFGNWEIKSQTWITTKNERRFGAGLRLVGSILAVVPDEVVTLAPADTRALIAESLNATLDEVVEMLPES
jgi:hypothetical protein